jgi:hypothetical protein
MWQWGRLIERRLIEPRLKPADSGLPVQFSVISGPAEFVSDDTLEFMPVPPKSRFPVRVLIGAY